MQRVLVVMRQCCTLVLMFPVFQLNNRRSVGVLVFWGIQQNTSLGHKTKTSPICWAIRGCPPRKTTAQYSLKRKLYKTVLKVVWFCLSFIFACVCVFLLLFLVGPRRRLKATPIPRGRGRSTRQAVHAATAEAAARTRSRCKAARIKCTPTECG